MGVVFGERSREVLANMLTLREQEQKKEKKVSFVHLCTCSSFHQGIKPPFCSFVWAGFRTASCVCTWQHKSEVLTFVAMVTQLCLVLTLSYYKQQPADYGMYCSWNLIDTINTHI